MNNQNKGHRESPRITRYRYHQLSPRRINPKPQLLASTHPPSTLSNFSTRSIRSCIQVQPRLSNSIRNSLFIPANTAYPYQVNGIHPTVDQNESSSSYFALQSSPALVSHEPATSPCPSTIPDIRIGSDDNSEGKKQYASNGGTSKPAGHLHDRHSRQLRELSHPGTVPVAGKSPLTTTFARAQNLQEESFTKDSTDRPLLNWIIYRNQRFSAIERD
ncbi:hypothetical protein HOY80DRAFT_1002347 [Tuber brumale]|nr:hypothetical protein HOY80DRAFT_1002347 [Tuber brumale]